MDPMVHRSSSGMTSDRPIISCVYLALVEASFEEISRHPLGAKGARESRLGASSPEAATGIHGLLFELLHHS